MPRTHSRRRNSNAQPRYVGFFNGVEIELEEEEEEEEQEEEEEEGDEEEQDEEEEEDDADDTVEDRGVEILEVDADDRAEEREVEIVEIEDSLRQTNWSDDTDGREGGKRRKVEREINGRENCKEKQSQENVWNRSEIEGLFCPICMEAWTSEGDHHISCLPCGHLFGLSCITKWIKQNRSSAKCPQCNQKSTLKDIRKLFAPKIAAVDVESQNRIKYLEAKCALLEGERLKWTEKVSEMEKREIAWELKISMIEESFQKTNKLVDQIRSRLLCQSCERLDASGNSVNSTFSSQRSCGSFSFQRELKVDGARLFDIDAFGDQVLLLARKSTGASYILTKISLIPPHEREDIFLPNSTKMIKDLHFSPSDRNLALFVSLGKEISLISTESNNVILSYSLPVPAWSCSWDINSSNYIYAGLQNGSLLVFDIRQTAKAVESRPGLTKNPVHTIHSLRDDSTRPSGVRTLLSASSVGVCQWKFGGVEERPLHVPETTNQGVCIALAHSPISNDIVASFRPRVETSDAAAASQMVLTPPSATRPPAIGSYLHLKRAGDDFQTLGTGRGFVSDIRLPRTTIACTENQKPLFASVDEVLNGLVLQELPSFAVAQQLKSHSRRHSICDVKYTSTSNQGLLGCLSEDIVQLFSTELV